MSELWGAEPVGYVHFTDKRFLEIPIDELKGNGILYWLSFDEYGMLIENV